MGIKEMRTDKNALVTGYTKAGYTLTPLNGKVPVKREWVKTEYNPLTTGGDFIGNYGVVLQKDDLIIDVDPRRFPEGVNVLAKLVKDFDLDIKGTFAVKTGGNGLHIYYKKPSEIAVKNALKEYPGIEFKSYGGQVVGAGSIHPETGLPYIVLCNGFEPAMAPEGLLNAIQRQDVELSKENDNDFTDDEQNIKRYKQYLLTSQKAIEGEGGDALTFKTACRGRDFALSEAKTFELMADYWNSECEPPWELEDLKKKVHNAYTYNGDSVGKRTAENDFSDFKGTDNDSAESFAWDVDKNGMPSNTLRNVVNYLICKDYPVYEMIKYNDFTGDITFVKPAPWHNGRVHGIWTDDDAIQFKFWLNTQKGFKTSTVLCNEAAIIAASKYRYHPVINYLTGLTWDKVPRLDTWLRDYAHVDDNPYTRAVGAKTIMGAVARVIHPGKKFDTMLVLEGEQGIGKSTLVSILGGNWYGDISITDNDKDTIDAMRGSWIIEVSEMVCSRKVETDKLKSFLSKTTDRVRLAYRRNAEDFPRQSIFIGTINPEEGSGYLKDTTGNRRFWPVTCNGTIDNEGLRGVRDQLFAEAYSRYMKDEKLYLNEELSKMAHEETEKRRQQDPWLEPIREWLLRPDIETKEPKKVVTAIEILEQCIGIPVSRISRLDTSRVARIMVKELRWEKGKFYIKRYGKSVWGYRLPQNVLSLRMLGLE